ncbi:MAG: NAD(P)H-hydrate dehydratase [Bacteroidales bacterium]|nr:NAD(P)H-hydrate dehydratase [Bacteroidales bacterium]
MKKVFVNGYGSIGSRITSFLKDDSEISVIGVGKYSPDEKVDVAISRGLNVYVPENKLDTFSNFKISGTIESALDDCDLVIDALFGSGLSRKIEGFYAEIITHINNSKAKIVSIDIPSGFFSENNSSHSIDTDGTYKNVIKANYTLSLELPFLSFFFPDAEQHVGSWECLSIGLNKKYLKELPGKDYFITKKMIKRILKKRNKFDHKGTYGHALLIAGSYGKMGAAILAAKACLRTGVGLLTTHFPVSGYEIMQTAVPEAMVCIDESGTRFCKSDEQNLYQAIGIGPGIGQKKATLNSLIGILNNAQKPVVLDADALNLLAANRFLYDLIPENSILTPHPGEFRRLAGETTSYFEQYQKQIALAKEQKVIVVLKGAYSSIALPDGRCYFNSTGNPGMGTAGSGDVLTGIITSLLAQGYLPEHAAVFGVYLHGLAGDIAAKQKSMQALIAGDIIENIGAAYKKTDNS